MSIKAETAGIKPAVRWEWSPNADDGRPRKEVNKMDWNESITRYLQANAKNVTTLSDVLFCGELEDAIETQVDIIRNIMSAETDTAEFIDSFSLSEINADAVKKCKQTFIETNQKIIMHIQKLQLDGYKLDKVKTTVQLETITLSKELSLLG